MSCYNWERGDIKIPPNQWAKFKERLRTAFNELQDRRKQIAVTIYDWLYASLKGKRGVDWYKVLTQDWYRREKFPSEHEQMALGIPRDYLQEDWCWREVNNALFPQDSRPVKRPRKPTGKNFPHATLRTTTYDLIDGTIALDNEHTCVLWDVRENNHAVERAREHPMGKAFFQALEWVRWTSRSGGTIVGNDEYNRDTDYEGGGANYVTFRFGATRKRYEDQFKPKRSKARR